jgi:hypothetical protein
VSTPSEVSLDLLKWDPKDLAVITLPTVVNETDRRLPNDGYYISLLDNYKWTTLDDSSNPPKILVDTEMMQAGA